MVNEKLKELVFRLFTEEERLENAKKVVLKENALEDPIGIIIYSKALIEEIARIKGYITEYSNQGYENAIGELADQVSKAISVMKSLYFAPECEYGDQYLNLQSILLKNFADLSEGVKLPNIDTLDIMGKHFEGRIIGLEHKTDRPYGNWILFKTESESLKLNDIYFQYATLKGRSLNLIIPHQ